MLWERVRDRARYQRRAEAAVGTPRYKKCARSAQNRLPHARIGPRLGPANRRRIKEIGNGWIDTHSHFTYTVKAVEDIRLSMGWTCPLAGR